MQSKKMWQDVKSFIKAFTIAVPIAFTFVEKVGYVSKVTGKSMQPVFNPESSTGQKDFVFVNKMACRRYNFKRGEIVSLKSPKNPQHNLIKRVVALEDDIIVHRTHRAELHRVPKGHCWVEGDNTEHSMDSNKFGAVPLGLLYGKVKYIVWPPRRWQKLDTVEELSDRIRSTTL